MTKTLSALLADRFGAVGPVPAEMDIGNLARLADHRTIRRYADRPVGDAVVETLCAVALSAPTKSDLQQRDFVILRDRDLRAWVGSLFPADPWIGTAPAMVIVCANNRRHRQVHGLRGHPFANDHLDAFFNAAVDAGIALQAFVTAAEAAGLGACPISAIRDHVAAVSERLALPDHVFPVAGITLGYPADPGRISMRLPLKTTVHVDRFDDATFPADLADYDARRRAAQPYRTQRDPDRFGVAADYCWSEDKARQYAVPQRPDFGAFVRAKGFGLS